MPVCAGALPTTCAAAADELSLLPLAFAWIVGGSVCSDVPEPAVPGPARHQNHSYSQRSQVAGDIQGPRCWSPAQLTSPTTEDNRVDVPIRSAHDLGSTCSSSSRRRCSSSRVELSKRLVRERHPLRVVIPLRSNESSPPNIALSPPKVSTPPSAYGANRPTTS